MWCSAAGQHPTKRRTRTSPLPAPDRRCRAWAIISRVAAPELSRTCLGEREPRCPPGKNEALFREVNERLQTLKEGFATITDTFEILCECALLECFDHIAMAPRAYEEMCADATLFAVRAGHEADAWRTSSPRTRATTSFARVPGRHARSPRRRTHDPELANSAFNRTPKAVVSLRSAQPTTEGRTEWHHLQARAGRRDARRPPFSRRPY
jgi:hypothetical protein